MNAFEILALIGAVTGPPAAASQIWSVVRDRPRLKIGFGTTTSLTAPPGLRVSIRNDGRQLITVRKAGFYGSEMPIQIDSQDLGKLRGKATYELNILDEPVLLDPGHYREFEAGPPDAVDYGYHVDFPFRAFAEDARGKRVWGEAAPISRMLFGAGSCPPGCPERQWNPTKKPLKPARVEPWWKYWIRRELRRGNPGRPSADELADLTGSSR